MNSRVVKKKVRIDPYDVFALKGDIAGQLALGEKERELFSGSYKRYSRKCSTIC